MASAENVSLLRPRNLIVGAAALLLVAVLGLCFFVLRASSRERGAGGKTPPLVRVVKPKAGGLDRITKLPATIHAFEYEDLKAAASGFLINQKVDIGSKVKKGETLAEIYAPELIKDRDLAAANLEKFKAQVKQMEAAKKSAEAAVKRATSAVKKSRAEITRAKSVVAYRQSKYDRFKALLKEGVGSELYVDEEFQQLEAAKSSRDAAEAAVENALDDVEFRKAEVIRAEADIGAAEAGQKIAEAALAKAEELVAFTKIRSHYTGTITRRAFHDGAYIAAADKGGPALYAIKAMGTMRVIVQVPDADAPYADVGDKVELTISTLPAEKIPGGLKISRVADGQAERTRTRRVEIDLPNKNGYLQDGMYGEVKIILEKGDPKAFTVPATCLHEERGKPRLYVFRDGVARIVPVDVRRKDGTLAEIRASLRPTDLVIADHSGPLRDGDPVEPGEVEQVAESP